MIKIRAIEERKMDLLNDDCVCCIIRCIDKKIWRCREINRQWYRCILRMLDQKITAPGNTLISLKLPALNHLPEMVSIIPNLLIDEDVLIEKFLTHTHINNNLRNLVLHSPDCELVLRQPLRLESYPTIRFLLLDGIMMPSCKLKIPDLKYLNIEGCFLDNLDMSGTPQLRRISIKNIEDTGIRITMPNKLNCLTLIDCDNIRFSKQNGISNLTALEYLSIKNDESDSISQLVNPSNFKHLSKLICLSHAGKNELQDIDLERVTTLKELSLSKNTRLTDLSISKLTRLEALILPESTRITDNSISRLVDLTMLVIPKSSITNSGLSNLTRLTVLEINNACIISDTTLSKMKRLEKLVINTGKGLRRIKINGSFLEHLPNIVTLSVLGHTLIKWESINGLEKIDYFTATGPEITDTVLSKLVNCTKLQLVKCPNVHGTTLHSLPKLRTLSVGFAVTPVSDSIVDALRSNGIKVERVDTCTCDNMYC